MATNYHLGVVQQIIHYTFKCRDLLQLALTAAGAEEAKPDGNRNLASVGQAVLQLIIANMGYENSETRQVTHGIQSLLYNKERLAAAAKRAGIQRCIKLCQKPGSTSATVMSGAVRAILGAAWKDSGSLDVVLDILRRFSLSPEAVAPGCHESVDPLQTLHSSSTFPITMEPNYQGTLTSVSSLDNFTGTTCTNATPDPGSPRTLSPVCRRRSKHNESEPLREICTEARARKRPKQHQNSTSEPEIEWLSLYIAEEEERCSELGLPGPRQTFMNESTVKVLSDLACKNGDIPAKIAVGVCSASAIIALRGAIGALRKEPGSHSYSLLHGITAPERFAAIEMADQQISSLTLLKRCHVLKLWEDYCKPGSASRFIMYEGSQKETCKGAGNPRNIEKNRTTRTLLSHICPGLEEESSDYARMHEKAKTLERLGRRLDTLSCRYGIGILGLLLEITDQMLLKPTDADFEQLLRMLDRSQGKEMQAFAEAVTPVVHCVLQGTLQNSDFFLFELAECSYIVGLPKSSPALLSLLAGHNLQRPSQDVLDSRYFRSQTQRQTFNYRGSPGVEVTVGLPWSCHPTDP